jgi:hypothetical protein
MGRVRSRVATVVTTVAFVASGAAGVAAIGLVTSATPAAAATKGTDTVTAYPAPDSQVAPNTHYYRLRAAPGASVTQTVHLVNKNKHDIDVKIAGLDGYTSDATGAAYTTPGRVAEKAGTWIVVSTPELTLAPSEERDVTFTLHVPKNAKPGEYLGAIGLWVPLESSSTTVPGGTQAGFAVTLQGERVIAVEVVVPGPTQASLAVTGVKPAAGPDGLRLQVGIANKGNTFTHGSGVVTVADTQLNYPFKIDTFVSHTAITYRVPWTRTVVPGNHDVSIKLTYDDGRVTTWNGTVAIGGSLQRQLTKDLRDNTVGAAKPASSHSLSPLLIAAVVGAFVCIGGAVLMRRRRRRDPLLAS